MADSESLGVPSNGPEGAELNLTESPNDSPLGVYSPFPYSPESFADLSDDARGALITLDNIAAKADIAARYMEIEQAWEACHFERGYQHLLRGRKGGWELPGANTGYGARDQKNHNTIYDTNVYGPKGDIIVAALSREVPKVEFFAANPDYAPDVTAAEEANNFKKIWSRNNNLHQIVTDCARIFWNEDRVLLWTRFELDGQKYGFENEEIEDVPLVPEDLLTPPDEIPTGQEQDDLETVEKKSPEENENGLGLTGLEEYLGTDKRKPIGREVTTVHGKLDHKVPIGADNIKEMPYVQLAFEFDVAYARGMFPWISDKIRPGSDGNADTQLDRIARQNVRQAVLGAYVTGDSLSRQTTVRFTWMRPSMFLDQSVNDSVRAELIESFPDGVLLARAGQEFAFARNERMDDHIVIAHGTAGKGQNRRSLGTPLISIQKRINDWVDLMDDFFKRTVPKKWYNSEVFNMDAMKKEPNIPGSSGPFLPQAGLTTEQQYILVEPTPQPQAALPEFIKWFITQLSEEISGALPSLFGAATQEETATNAVLQNSSALQRIGCPWNCLQDAVAESAAQAVKCAAECRNGKKVSENIEKVGMVSVNTANLLRGKVQCYPESNPAFPESWQQREAKLMTMIDASSQNQMLAQWLMSPQNLPALADGIRMKDFKVPGASSITKQKAEFELLLRAAPIDNPQYLQVQNAIEQAQEGIKQSQEAGQPVPPEAAAMLQQLQQVAKTLPPKISSVPVAQDESELHIVEAAQCFEWMNSSEGQKFRFGTQKQQLGYENVHLHWQEHVTVAKRIAKENAPPPEQKQPSESISVPVDKMPPAISVQALAKMGIMATPEMFAQHTETQLNDKVAAKTIPDALRKNQ